MAQPLSYYQNQLAENVIPAINNSTIQVPAQLQGSLIAYDSINNLLKQELITGTVNTILYQSLITQNVAVVNTPLPITGAVNVNVVGDQVTANVSVMNFPSNQTVTVSNTPLPITGSVDTTIIGSNITQNVNVVNFPSNQTVTVSNTPLPITGSVDTTIIGSNITQNVNTVGVGYNQINVYSSAFITSNSQTIINTAQYQEMVVDTVFGGVITGAIWVGVYGVEPQSSILTSLLASTNTATSNTLTVQRLQISGPLGAEVAVTVNVASGSEITGVYVTVEQSVVR